MTQTQSSPNNIPLDLYAPTLENTGVFFLNGDIDDENCGQAIRFILEANLSPPATRNFDHITLIVNSLGGLCHSGFALVDVIDW